MLRIPELPVECLLAFTSNTTLRGLDGRGFDFPAAEIFRATLVEIIPEEEGTPALYEFKMWISDPSVGEDHKTFLIDQSHVQIVPIPPPVTSDRPIPLTGWSVPVPYGARNA